MKRFVIPICFLVSNISVAQSSTSHKATVQIDYGMAPKRFVPSRALGAAFDGHGYGDINRILAPDNINAMRKLGFGPLAFRLRTELGAEAWHWNPKGTWSEPEKEQGYWKSDDHSTGDIEISNGYRLPRRGNSHDQANDDGYSMVDDGDTNTIWKSNPYLDQYFTKDSNTQHPQWVVVDLGKSYPVNAIRINWGNPYALSYTIDYAGDIGKDYFDPMQPDLWHDFTKGNVVNQDGSKRSISISDTPIRLRFVRITMTQGSGATSVYSKDIRDKLGFAIREIEVGLLENEKFHDYVKHAPDNEKQSVIHTSSTDPWHRAIDLDKETEQAGIDKFFKCGLSVDQPVLMPVALLYGTPDDAVALVSYINDKKYNTGDNNANEYEMGEEPEGQLIDPQDYAALYCEWAQAIKKVDSSIHFGGPGFAALATTPDDEYSFTEQKWTRIFLAYLKDHNQLNDFNFFSFEWYPFDDICAPTPPQLASHPYLLSNALKDLQGSILPACTPIYITEYGYSSHSGRAEVDIEGALMYADIIGKALTLGVSKAFLYGYEPTTLDVYNNCSWGNNMLFAMDDEGKIKYHTAAWYGINMLMHTWAVPADSTLEIYEGHSTHINKEEQDLLSSYAIRTHQNKWSIVLINKDPAKRYSVTIKVVNSLTGTNSELKPPFHIVQYSRAQYHWKVNGPKGHPTLEVSPLEKTLETGSLNLPPYSLTVINKG